MTKRRTRTAPRSEEPNDHGYLAAIVDSTDDAIISKDVDGVIRSANVAAVRLFGYTAEELVGHPVRMLIPDERQSEEDEILARIRRGERVDHFETVRLAKDGRRIDVSLTISPVRDRSGVVVGASKIARDITELKRAREAQAYLAAIVASSDDAIIAKDLNGIIQSCNAAAERIFGYSAAELVGRPVLMLIPPDRHAEEADILGRIRRGDRIEHFETVRLAKGNRLIDISLTVSAVRDATGQIVGASKIARDVTEQKRALAAAAAQRAWFETTLESIGDAVIATDVRGCVAFMNPVAEQLTGWHASEAQGRPCLDVFHVINEQTGEVAESPVGRVLAEGVVIALANHTVLIAADGTRRPIDDSGAPIRNHEGRVIGVVLVFRDVSERRRLEVERQTHLAERERLLEAERLARGEAERASRVKDDFVAMVSHELRTPLNAILGWTTLMTQRRNDSTVLDRGLDVVARNTRLQAQLVSDLLDISRIIAGKLRLDLQSVDLRDILADAIETIQQEAEAKGVRVEAQVDERSGAVAGDPARLQQVVWNLLSNAVKFTPRGGTVRATLRLTETTADVSVSDDGRGIPADVLPLVFDRFHQADRSITRRFGGLGLGLAIVKHLVELHGGTVRAESAGEGQGATFVVSLPMSTATAVPGSPTPLTSADEDAVPADALEGIRTLIVDDEPDTLEFLRRLVEGHGATVIVASTAVEALARMRDELPEVLVSDIGLPEIDGYDLMQRIQKERPDHRFVAIALTAYARAEDRARALRAGYQAHLAKPVESAELIATIANLLTLSTAVRRRS